MNELLALAVIAKGGYDLCLRGADDRPEEAMDVVPCALRLEDAPDRLLLTGGRQIAPPRRGAESRRFGARRERRAHALLERFPHSVIFGIALSWPQDVFRRHRVLILLVPRKDKLLGVRLQLGPDSVQLGRGNAGGQRTPAITLAQEEDEV